MAADAHDAARSSLHGSGLTLTSKKMDDPSTMMESRETVRVFIFSLEGVPRT